MQGETEKRPSAIEFMMVSLCFIVWSVSTLLEVNGIVLSGFLKWADLVDMSLLSVPIISR